jgi:CubicO group peptidase (beta-lactamase class C family)
MSKRFATILTSSIFSALIGMAAHAQPAAQGIVGSLQPFVENHTIAGAVTLVASKDKVLSLEAVGYADLAANKPMRADCLFWIASMTKPVTATAVLMLQDEGKLSVDDPVAKYLPELANLKTADGKPAKLTLRHLLTHTSGLAEATKEESQAARKLADLVPHYAERPLRFEPGSKWQ